LKKDRELLYERDFRKDGNLRNDGCDGISTHMQKKSALKEKRSERPKSGGTKIVVLPQNNPVAHSHNDTLMDTLRKSLM